MHDMTITNGSAEELVREAERKAKHHEAVYRMEHESGAQNEENSGEEKGEPK